MVPISTLKLTDPLNDCTAVKQVSLISLHYITPLVFDLPQFVSRYTGLRDQGVYPPPPLSF
jgi:hypothetical protein